MSSESDLVTYAISALHRAETEMAALKRQVAQLGECGSYVITSYCGIAYIHTVIHTCFHKFNSFSYYVLKLQSQAMTNRDS